MNNGPTTGWPPYDWPAMPTDPVGPKLPVVETRLLLDEVEVPHAESTATCWWYGALDPPDNQSGFFAFGGPVLFALTAGASLAADAHRRATARRAVTPQWRNLGLGTVTITSHRTVIQLDTDWISFWHDDLLHLTADPGIPYVQLTLHNGEPYALTGPAAPHLGATLNTLF
jgi:hypothetical protein